MAVRYAGPDTPAGCLVVVNAGHLCEDAPRALEALTASVSQEEMRIAHTLERAVGTGDLRPNAPVQPLARLLTATTQGMATMARLGREEAAVQEIGRLGLSVLSSS